MFRPLTISIAAAALLVASPWATPSAQAEEDFFEPISMGMGGAVRNLGLDAAAIHLNPASMTGKPRYVTGSNYTYYGRERSHTIASAAYDSRTSAFSLGTQYTVQIFEPPFDPAIDLRWFPVDDAAEIEDKRTWQRWDIAAGYALLDRRLNVGLSGRIVRQRFAIREDRTFFTMDGGVTVWPLPFLVVGVSVQNFIPTKDERFPVRLSPGVALDIGEVVKIGFDMVFDFTSGDEIYTDLHGGAEVSIAGIVAIRGGYYSDRKFTENYVTWGLGLNVQQAKLTLNFAMRIEVGPMERRLRLDKPEANNRILNTFGFDLRF